MKQTVSQTAQNHVVKWELFVFVSNASLSLKHYISPYYLPTAKPLLFNTIISICRASAVQMSYMTPL